MKKDEFTPIYVDGVIKLHTQLHDAFQKAAKLANKVLGTPMPSDRTGYSIYVDNTGTRPENMLKGYIMSKKTILRFLPVELDYAVLFPVRNHGGGTFKVSKGIKFEELKQTMMERDSFRIVFKPLMDIEDKNFYYSYFWHTSEFATANPTGVNDDLGKIVSGFTDINCLKLVDIPYRLTEKDYTLVGKQFYAPYSTDKETYCVLYAQLNNQYDTNAIQVLRWIPENKGKEADQLLGLSPDGGDVFFELGHIARTENSELHSFMVENDSRLLFGKRTGNKIRILGGAKIFETNEIKYPRCLYNIPLK